MKPLHAFGRVEILAIVAVLLLLGSLTFVGLRYSLAAQRDDQRHYDMHTIETALDLYHSEHHQFPTELPGGTGCWSDWQSGNSVGGSNDWLSSLVNGGYLTIAPQEKGPLQGCTYRYMRLTGAPSSCGSKTGNYALIYAQTEHARPNDSPYAQPSCMAGWGMTEAGAKDPNGNLILLPE